MSVVVSAAVTPLVAGAAVPHCRGEATPGVGHDLQSEYLLPRNHAAAALAAVRDRFAPLLGVGERRNDLLDAYLPN